MRIADLSPAFEWTASYTSKTFRKDLLAAIIVTIMLVPQSLAYAQLAGLPPVTGLYASMLPLVAYALFGSSMQLAVGPVAIVSILTATAASDFATSGTSEYLTVTITLAFISGAMMTVMGLLRLGFIANLLSQPVVSAFISATGGLIVVSQLQPLLGTKHSIVTELYAHGPTFLYNSVHLPTAVLGLASLGLLLSSRSKLVSKLLAKRLRSGTDRLVIKLVPLAVIGLACSCTAALGLEKQGVAILGELPTSLPSISLPTFSLELWRELMLPAALISLIGFVESIAVGRDLAARGNSHIAPNKELVALGAANLASGLSGAFPVTGGISRSAVNYDAGAETPAAGVLTAIGIALAILAFTPYMYFVPDAVLSATIIVAVSSLIKFRELIEVWRFSKPDFAAMLTTILATFIYGIEFGILSGIGLSIVFHLYRTSRPHYAIVGRVPGTQHYRNITRHAVVDSATALTLRFDESLTFANAEQLRQQVSDACLNKCSCKHVILLCSGINGIDVTGLKSLESINRTLSEKGIFFHLSELKGPVMDQLMKSDLLKTLSGQIFLSQYEALAVLDPLTVETPLTR